MRSASSARPTHTRAVDSCGTVFSVLGEMRNLKQDCKTRMKVCVERGLPFSPGWVCIAIKLASSAINAR